MNEEEVPGHSVTPPPLTFEGPGARGPNQVQNYFKNVTNFWKISWTIFGSKIDPKIIQKFCFRAPPRTLAGGQPPAPPRPKKTASLGPIYI